MLKRTHKLDEIDDSLIGEKVIINGWIDRMRNLGGIVFSWIRDRYGLVQVVFDPQKAVYEKVKRLSNEYVVAIEGIVRARPEDAKNPKLKSGNVEILAEELEILAEAKTPPIYINREEGNEEIRLRYRYLDLRRSALQRNLIFRHKVAHFIRQYMNSKGFIEIETPYLTKSTPEGARDFLVPSRLKRGSFYALPQSPQIFKQLLMIAGFDRYYQIVRCFRDEDLRADRQPEFTQVDLEMSFADQSDVLNFVSGLVKGLYEKLMDVDVKEIPIVSYSEAMEKYGSDKPDLRFGMQLQDLTCEKFANELSFLAPSEGEALKFIKMESNVSFSRKVLDSYANSAKSKGLRLGWMKKSNDALSGSVAKIFKGLEIDLDLKNDELVILCAGERQAVNKFLGEVRLDVAQKANLVNGKSNKILWVVDFPMFEWNEEEKRYQAQHHPFTMPYLEDLEKYPDDPSKIRAHSYDLIINGWEMGSGSVRIHTKALQEKVFKLIGISENEAKARFGFFLEAFEYGTPPHAGFAIGFDRLIAVMTKSSSLRDVIAFPKTTSGTDLMVDAPSTVSKAQLKELGIKLEVDE